MRAVVFAAALALVPALAPAAAPIQTLTSPGGAGFWLVEERTIPMVAVEIAFEGGAATDPEGKEGVANFLAGMLNEGAGELDSVAYAARAERLGARFGFDAGRDAFSVSARMLSDNLDDSVALLRDALTAPRFDPEPLARVRAQIVSAIRQRESDPGALASEAFFAGAFPGDPYGRPVSGAVGSVEAIGADDLRAARLRLLTRGGAKIGVVGAIGPEAAGRMVDRLVGDLAAEAPSAPAPVDPRFAAGVRVIDYDAPQSMVMFGHEGPLRDDPDFIPAYVMNYILGGGGFSSRLTQEVRVERGLAYSTYAYLAPLDRAGLYMGGLGADNARVAEAIDVVRDEWRRMSQEGVSDAELSAARTYLTGAWPLRFDGNDDIASILVGLQRDGLGPEYVDERNALVVAVTRDDIARVAGEWLRPESLSFVVVGRPEGLDTMR